jgi:hypothetical protein
MSIELLPSERGRGNLTSMGVKRLTVPTGSDPSSRNCRKLCSGDLRVTNALFPRGLFKDAVQTGQMIGQFP